MKLTLDQRAAVESLDQNCVVSAGAGSGKTRVLVERYLRILEREREVVNPFPCVLAITFTDKAAAEMKDRIRQGIRKRAERQQGSRSDLEPPWSEWLVQVEGAQVMTFHAFCAALLREFPVEADVDPQFAVADEQECGEWLTQVVEEGLTRALEKKNTALESLLLAWGFHGAVTGLERLYGQMVALGWSAEELADRTHTHLQEMTSTREREEQKHRLQFRVAAEALVSLKGGKLLQRFQQAWPNLVARLHSQDHRERLWVAQTSLSLLKGNWGRDSTLLQWREQARTAVQSWAMVLKGMIAAPQEVELAAIVSDLLRDVEKAYQQRKSERQALDFDDLQMRAIRLLQEHTPVAETLRRRIRYVMVDEFQDTNPVQKELFQLLLPGPAGEQVPGKGFVVGDPKQSIYRFRGADVGLFAQTREEFLAVGGSEVLLLDNFRSGKGVIAAIDRLFTPLFSDYRHARSYHEDGEDAPVEVLLDRGEEKTDPLEAEANAVSKRIEALLQQGTQPGEIAVLFQAMTHVKVFAEALTKLAIPFHVVKGRGFFQQQEVWDLIHILRLLADPEDRLSLVGCLRSPLCGVSDETLYRLSRREEWYRQPQHWAAWIEDLPYEQLKLSRFVADWNRWRRWVGRIPVADLLERIIRETELREIWATTPHGKQAIANVNKLVRMARQWGEGMTYSLSAWLERLQGTLARQIPETEAPLAPSEQNRVALMTIHQSKGLEFPVVFVPELAKKPQVKWGEMQLDRQWGLVMKIPDAVGGWEETDRWVQWRERETERAREESVRLFYVAATRAIRKLILSGAPQEHKGAATGKPLLSADTWAKWLDGILGYDRIDWERGRWTFPGEEDGPTLTVRTFTGEAESEGDVKKKSARMSNSLSTPIDTAWRWWEPRGWTAVDRLEVSVTDLTVLANCPRRYFFAEILQMPEWEGETKFGSHSSTGPLAPRVRGELIHRLLETMDDIPQSDADWMPTVQRLLAESEIHPANHERALRQFQPLVRAYVQSRYCQEMHTMAGQLREAPFTLERDGLRVTGTIDRLHCTRDGHWELVDWKTNDVEADEVEELAQEYLPQLQLYSLAIRQVWGIELDRAVLYFLKPNREIAFTVDHRWMNAAEETLTRWTDRLQGEDSSSFPPQPGKRCQYCPYAAWCDAVQMS
ncbi:UvrD-helicase domain-containing protein [Desmospora activa]|uniref:DNA 3'-5' helicase n=1 Tax=Desmospora activa DSM 45169 TaxID=1121389 RepID=A0A2T4ZCR1_9BACL|nr:UvrD-helicase domain-containing protein [Desmospora activa]PTM59688.1 ATP-dependent helicase/nuclease subunit A [Desmospora activa DSM 45169]